MTFYDTASGRINVIEILSSKPIGQAVLCIHGICCDARIFAYAGARLAQAGYDTYAMDLPGHGKSDGQRGDLDFNACIKSIDKIVAELKKKSSKVFILTHSFGSTFALWYAHLYSSVDGIILLAPYVRIGHKKRSDAEPSLSTFLYLLLGRLFTPYKRVNFGKILPGYVKIGGSQLARMVQDLELNFDYSFRYLVDVVANRNSKIAELSDINIPVLILHGENDRNVYLRVSEEFFKLLRTKNKEMRVFDCNHWFYDAIFFSQSTEYSEQDRVRLVSSIVEWLNKI